MPWKIKGSAKADRSKTAEHWKHILSYEELTKLIQEAPTTKEWQKPFFATAVLTGARKGEIREIKKKDIVWFDAYKKVIADPKSYLSVYRADFYLNNEKNKQTPFKTISVPKKQIFAPLLNIVFDYWLSIHSPEEKLFDVNASRVWQVYKEVFGRSWYPHITRHFAASNDTILGLKDISIRSKFGWADSRMQNNYAHFNTQNYLDDLDRVLTDRYNIEVVVPPKVPDVVIQQVERLPDAPKLPDEVKLLPTPLSQVVEIVQPKPSIKKTVMPSIENKRIIQKVLKKPMPRRVLLIKRGVVNV